MEILDFPVTIEVIVTYVLPDLTEKTIRIEEQNQFSELLYLGSLQQDILVNNLVDDLISQVPEDSLYFYEPEILVHGKANFTSSNDLTDYDYAEIPENSFTSSLRKLRQYEGLNLILKD